MCYDMHTGRMAHVHTSSTRRSFPAAKQLGSRLTGIPNVSPKLWSNPYTVVQLQQRRRYYNQFNNTTCTKSREFFGTNMFFGTAVVCQVVTFCSKFLFTWPIGHWHTNTMYRWLNNKHEYVTMCRKKSLELASAKMTTAFASFRLNFGR